MSISISKCIYLSILRFADFIKYWEIQQKGGGKGVKGPSAQIFIFVFGVFDVIACDLKISIYRVNSPYKKKCTH